MKFNSRHYLIEDTPTDPTTIERLFRDGYISAAERAVLLARYHAQSSEPERAEEILRETLSRTTSDVEREQLLNTLLRLLADRERVTEAEALLEHEQCARPEFVALMRGFLVLKAQSRMRAIEYLRSTLSQFPRSLQILENIIHLLVDEARSYKPNQAEKDKQDNSRPLLEEAKGYAHCLVQILPSTENQILEAKLLAELGDTEQALEILQTIEANGYSTRNTFLVQGQLLMRLNRLRDAATLLDRAIDQYPSDYELMWLCGTAWAEASDYGRAIARFEPLLNYPEAGVELYINLGQVYLLEAAAKPDLAGRAFDLLKRAFDKDPTQPRLPALLLQAGMASGRSQEAWKLIGQLDLKENPYLRAIPAEEGLRFDKELTEQLHHIKIFYEAGMLPFATYSAHAPRPAWFLWWMRMMLFNKQWQAGASGAKPILVNLPPLDSMSIPSDMPRRGLLLDMTAILTLGTLRVTREILGALDAARCPVYLFPGCREWMAREVSRLKADQIPAYRRRFDEIRRILLEARTVVEIKHQPLFGESPLSETVLQSLGPIGHDIAHAIAAGAYYIDDYLESEHGSHIPKGIVVSSRQMLDSLVTQGLVLEAEAVHIRNMHPEPFDHKSPAEPVALDRPLVMSEPALIAWYNTGLLQRWLKGDIGWPHIIVGPWAWREIGDHAIESSLYQEALERAEATKAALDDALQTGSIQECAAPPKANLNLTGTEEFWESATRLLTSAKDHNLVVWADDLFLRSILDFRGLLSEDAAFRAMEARMRARFTGVRVIGTEDVLHWLNGREALDEDRQGELIWSLFTYGYRVISPRAALRWWLNQLPYVPSQPADPYRRILQDLEQTLDWIPETVRGDRRAQFAQMVLGAVILELVQEVWDVPAAGLTEPYRRELAEALLEIFEKGTEQ